MRRAAFTLVELLLVVAVIVLLISMLLPALGRSKERARMQQCAIHLHALGDAAAVYAGDNASRLPIYDPNPETGPNNMIQDPVLTYRVAEAPGETNPDAVTVRNHGVLYSRGYITTPSSFYCPTQRGSIWQEDLYVTPWITGGSRGHLNGTVVPGSTWLVRSAYLYIPHRFSPANDRRAYQRLERFNHKHVLMMDLLFATQQYDTVAHEKDTAWNVVHPDLSVRVYRSGWVYSEIANYPRLFWPQFEPALDALLEQR